VIKVDEIRLNVGSFWEHKSNIDSDIEQINWNIENNRNKKVIINLPITYFDEKLFAKINNLDAVEFESQDGRRFRPKDIILTNKKLNNILYKINDENLSPFEKFIVIYSFVVNFKAYKLGNEKYFDVGRSPYLFLDDEYINCVGMCQFLCILCRKAGINITMLANEEKGHAVCYCYIKDDKYSIDGHFCSDPTDDNVNEESPNCNYTHMIGHILFNNNFERFLNSNQRLSYPNDIIEINLFAKYVSFLKTYDFSVENIDNSIDFLYSFRDEYKSKQNGVAYNIIYSTILRLSQGGYIPSVNDNKDIMLSLLFIKEFKEKSILGKSTASMFESFINLSEEDKKRIRRIF